MCCIWLTLCSPWSGRPGYSYLVPLSKQPSEKASILGIHWLTKHPWKMKGVWKATALLQHEAVRVNVMNVIAQLTICKLLIVWGCFISAICIFHVDSSEDKLEKHDQFVGSVVPVHQCWSLNSLASNRNAWKIELFRDHMDHSCNSPVLFHILSYGNVQDTLPGSFSPKTHFCKRKDRTNHFQFQQCERQRQDTRHKTTIEIKKCQMLQRVVVE